MKAAYVAKVRTFVNVSTSIPCRSSDGHVVLFLIIPGMNDVPAGCAMLVGRLLQESIDRDLASKDLLMAESRSAGSLMAALEKEMTAQRLAAPRTAGLEFIKDVAERLYGGPLLSFVRHEDQFYFVFSVSDLETGLSAVKAEIKRLGFLQLAEIGHYDSETRVCRMHHPKQSATPLTLHCVEVLKEAGLLPR